MNIKLIKLNRNNKNFLFNFNLLTVMNFLDSFRDFNTELRAQIKNHFPENLNEVLSFYQKENAEKFELMKSNFLKRF